MPVSIRSASGSVAVLLVVLFSFSCATKRSLNNKVSSVVSEGTMLGSGASFKSQTFSIDFYSENKANNEKKVSQCYYRVFQEVSDTGAESTQDTFEFDLNKAVRLNERHLDKKLLIDVLNGKLEQAQFEYVKASSAWVLRASVPIIAGIAMTPVSAILHAAEGGAAAVVSAILHATEGGAAALDPAGSEGFDRATSEFVSRNPAERTQDFVRGVGVGFVTGAKWPWENWWGQLLRGSRDFRINEANRKRKSSVVQLEIAREASKSLSKFVGVKEEFRADKDMVEFFEATVISEGRSAPQLKAGSSAVPKTRCLTGAELAKKPEKWWQRMEALAGNVSEAELSNGAN